MLNEDYSKKYTKVQSLGHGSFGTVYIVKKEGVDNTRYVLKEMNITSKTSLKVLLNEVQILKRLNKKGCKSGILCFHESFVDTNRNIVGIVTELLEGSVTLRKYINDLKADRNPIPVADLLVIMKQLLLSLKTIHIQHVAHGDLKPENIIINTGTLLVQVIDFGSSCKEHKCSATGTLYYSSPEMIEALMYKKTLTLDQIRRSDIFSLGIVFYELANLELPYPTQKNLSPKELGSKESVRDSVIQDESEYQTLYGLYNFFKRGPHFFSSYNNDEQPIDQEINSLITSMLIVAEKRKSAKHLLSEINKMIHAQRSI